MSESPPPRRAKTPEADDAGAPKEEVEPKKSPMDRSLSPPAKVRDDRSPSRERVRSRSREPRRRSPSPERRRRSRSRDRRPVARSRSRDREYRRRSPPRYDVRRDDRGGSRRDRERSPGNERYRSSIYDRDHPRRTPDPDPDHNRSRSSKGIHLFIAGLNFICSERELTRKFERYGRVNEVRIVRNPQTGESRGFGFVIMEDDHDVQDAIDDLDGQDWQGRILKVERARNVRD